MKKILSILLLLFCLTFTSEIKAQNQPAVVTYIDWQLSNNACNGCAAFYWKANRTYFPNQQVYKFDLWFSSNSFYNNGIWASTYLGGIIIYSDNTQMNANSFWLLFKDQSTSGLSTFYSTNPNPYIKMTWQNLTVY